MTVAFLTQYYRGLGHSQRIKFIAEELGKVEKVIIMDQLFQPPLSYTVPHVSFLKDYKLSDVNNMFQFIMQEDLINFRIHMFVKTIEEHKVKTLVCEGFPFCRHQFAHEYLRYFEECKKRGIKIIISIRDFPWDEPHDNSLQDWVLYTQNIVCKYYAEKILVHGDPEILPLYGDRFRHANGKQIIDDIKDKIIYTGYVCDSSIKKHDKKNNNIFVSTGLNKEEGMLLFKHILKVSNKFKDYNFIMTVANRYLKTGNKKKDNIVMVEYIPNLREKLVDCAAYITYGGYNATVEILKSQIPSIIIPRQDGQKMEQFVRAYTFEPYNYFKVMTNQELGNLDKVLTGVLENKPNKFGYNMNGAKESANEIKTIHNG
jgi:predicted glycosyltransferase